MTTIFFIINALLVFSLAGVCYYLGFRQGENYVHQNRDTALRRWRNKDSVKTLFLSLAIVFAALAAQAQVTNVVVTAVIQLSTGVSYTNSVSNGNTNILAAATNAMTAFNLIRASQDPPKTATTNLSQYFIEFTKERFNLIKNEYDSQLVQDLSQKMSTLAETNKAKFRAILANP